MARYALVIGIATYDNFRSLSKAATDAEAIARLLEQHSYHVTRLPKKPVAENQQAIDFDGRLENIHLIQELKAFVRERGHQQEALIFFAGHGFRVTNPITDELEGYLATSDTTQEGKNAIPLKDLNALISQSELSSLVMLLDCCYVGLLGEQYNLLQSTQAAIRYKPNYCLIAACRNLEEAGEEQQHSIFTTAVLNGLSTVRAANSEITSIDLFSTVSQELQTNGREVVQATIGWAIPIVPCLSQELDAVEIDESETPYCGLEPFGENHAKFFCGRKQLIKDI